MITILREAMGGSLSMILYRTWCPLLAFYRRRLGLRDSPGRFTSVSLHVGPLRVLPCLLLKPAWDGPSSDALAGSHHISLSGVPDWV